MLLYRISLQSVNLLRIFLMRIWLKLRNLRISLIQSLETSLRSDVYHLLKVPARVEVVLRKLDHIMIFVLIAGTYTPICLIALRGPAGYAMLAVVWSLAVAGVFFKVFYLNAPRWAYTGIYLLMGWVCIFAIVPLARAVGLRRLVWLFAGGVFYSVGAVIYGLKKPNLIPGWLGFHEIFHIFIILGSLSHFCFVYLLA